MSAKDYQTKEHDHENDKRMQEVKEHLDYWQGGLQRLVKEVQYLKSETQNQYQPQIAALEAQLHNLQVRLKAMAEGEPKEWHEGRLGFAEQFARFRQAFLKTAQQINDSEEKVALGWLQGFTDKRTHESAGWAEGLAERPAGSEGWAEGLGKRPEGSKGWAEGYDGVKEK